MEALQGWRNSPDYQAALKMGVKYAKYNIIAVNGVKQQQPFDTSAEAAH